MAIPYLSRTDSVLSNVREERLRQIKVGYDPAHDREHTSKDWVSLLARQLGELGALAVNMPNAGRFREQDPSGLQVILRHILIQLAAVAVAAIETLDETERRLLLAEDSHASPASYGILEVGHLGESFAVYCPHCQKPFTAQLSVRAQIFADV